MNQRDPTIDIRCAASPRNKTSGCRCAVKTACSPGSERRKRKFGQVMEGNRKLRREEWTGVLHGACVPTTLGLHYLSLESGEHDCFWRTHRKLTQTFTSKNMRTGAARCFKTCHESRHNYARHNSDLERTSWSCRSTLTFHKSQCTLTSLNLKKKDGVRRTQSFSVAVGECYKFMAAKPSNEYANCLISRLERGVV